MPEGMTGLWDLLTGKKMDEHVDATLKQIINIYNQRGSLPAPASPGQLILYKRAAEKAALNGNFPISDFINNAMLPSQDVQPASGN